MGILNYTTAVINFLLSLVASSSTGYKGNVDCSVLPNGDPALTESYTGEVGDRYLCTVGGSADIGGFTTWVVGDVAIWDGTEWQRIPIETPELPPISISTSQTLDTHNATYLVTSDTEVTLTIPQTDSDNQATFVRVVKEAGTEAVTIVPDSGVEIVGGIESVLMKSDGDVATLYSTGDPTIGWVIIQKSLEDILIDVVEFLKDGNTAPDDELNWRVIVVDNTLSFERRQGGAWVSIFSIGSSVTTDRFIIDTTAGSVVFINKDGDTKTLIKPSIDESGAVVGNPEGRVAFINSGELFNVEFDIQNQLTKNIQTDTSESETHTDFYLPLYSNEVQAIKSANFSLANVPDGTIGRVSILSENDEVLAESDTDFNFSIGIGIELKNGMDTFELREDLALSAGFLMTIRFQTSNPVDIQGLTMDFGDGLGMRFVPYLTTQYFEGVQSDVITSENIANYIPDIPTDTIYTENGVIDDAYRTVDIYNDGFISLSSFDGADIADTTQYSLMKVQSAQVGLVSAVVENQSVVSQRSIVLSPFFGMQVVDSTDEIGMVYDDDYSANYTDRSLIDKAYSDLYSIYKSDGSWTGDRDIQSTENGSLTLEMYDNTPSDWTKRAFLDMSGQYGRILFSADVGSGSGGFTGTNALSLSSTSGLTVESTDGTPASYYGGDFDSNMTDDNHIPNVKYVKDNTFVNSDGTIPENRIMTGENSRFFRFVTYDTDEATYGKYGAVSIDDSYISLYRIYGDGAGNSVSSQGISIGNTGIRVDDSYRERGMEYGGDYSVEGVSAFGDRWIPDKGYVDSQLALFATLYGQDGGWSGSRLVTAEDYGELNISAYDTNASTYNEKSNFNISQAGIAFYYSTGNGSGSETGKKGFVSDTSGMFFENTVDNEAVEYTYTPEMNSDLSIPSYGDVKEYALTISESTQIPYVGDLANISLANSKQFDRGGNGMFMTADGTQVFIVTASGEVVYRFNLSTPWDVVSETETSATVISEAGNADFRGIHFNNDGTKMYLATASVYEYELSTPYDPASRNTGSYYKWEHGKGTCWGVRFNSDGTKLFLLSDTHDVIYRYTLSTPWDLTTVGTEDQTFDVSGQVAVTREMAFDSQGLNLYVLDGNDTVHQYKLSQAWSLDNVTYIASQVVLNTNARGMFVKPDTSRLYIHDFSSTFVYDYRFRIDSKNIAQSNPKADLYVSTSANTSTISPGNPINICENSTTQAGDMTAVDFTVGSNGRLTYTGDETMEFSVNAILSMTSTLDYKTISIYIAKNGNEIDNSEQIIRITTEIVNCSVGWTTELSKNDYIEVFADTSTATQLTPDKMYLKVKADN